MSDPQEAPPVGPALVVGAVKGALAGALALGAWGGLWIYFVALSMTPSTLSDTLSGMLGVALCGALAGATLCGLDAAARRVEGWPKLFLRLGAGFFAPIAAAAPAFSFATGGLGGDLPWEVFRVLAVLSSGLAVGQLAMGPPFERAHDPQSFKRLAKAAVASPAMVGVLVTTVQQVPPDACAGFVFGIFGCLVVAVTFWLAQLSVRRLTRRLAHWLEPELAEAEAAVAAARGVGERPRLALDRIEALLAEGDLARVEVLAPETGHEPLVRAEVARRRGDLARAGSLAEAWHDGFGDAESSRARSACANALLELALVRADEGRLDEARTLVAEAESECGSPELVFQHLTVERVRAYIEACTGRSRPG